MRSAAGQIVRILKPGFLVLLSACLAGAGAGCATVPKVPDVVRNAPAGPPPQILSAAGPLSPEKSKALLERLKRSAAPTDMLRRYNTVIESVSGTPLTAGNKVTLLVDGPATYASMFQAMESARDHINVETYIFEDDETGRRFADMFLKKQAEGVQVNVIYDSVGSHGTPATFFGRLRDAGVRVIAFNPISPREARRSKSLAHADHRKILIVDGRVAFTGGINISGVYSSRFPRKKVRGTRSPPWRDTDVRIEGPAVAEFQKLFLDMWRRVDRAGPPGRNYFPPLAAEGNTLVQAVGSSPGSENRLTYVLYAAAITFAEHSIHVTNAYFVPDDKTLNALCDAARRGVDVKLVLPGTTDALLTLSAGRYYYARLLKAGVRLYERRGALLHAKTAVVDGIWSTVGSTNMDFWSFSTNDEVNAVILSAEFAGEMERLFARDLAESDEIRPEDWKNRPLFPRIREWFAHLFARWL